MPDEIKDAAIESEDIDLKEQAVQAEKELLETTEERLEKTFVTGEKLEMPAEPSDEDDDSTPEEEPAEESDDEDGPTQAEKKEEAKLEAEQKDKEVEPEAKDEDADKGDEEESVPQLSDAYCRAAIHRGWTEKEIDDLYKENPELCVRTLGRIYEGVNRSTRDFAAIGRALKLQETTKREVESDKPENKSGESEFKGVDVEKLRADNPDDPLVDVIAGLNQQNKILYDNANKTRSVQATDQPSGLTQEQIRATEKEAAAIEQQIETFFESDELKKYGDFYGGVSKDDTDWNSLTPGQKMNRWTVVEMMDQMIAGAQVHGRKMEIGEAMNLAHLSVTEPIREKVIREQIKSDVTKRSKSLSLKPSSAAQPESTKPQTPQELEAVTEQRLRKVFGGS